MPVMSQRAYARHRGVSASTVQKAIGSGRVHTLPNGQIDSEAADAEWARNTQTQAPPVDRHSQQPDDDAEIFGASQYQKARAVREHYQARLAKLEYEERVEKLIPADEVKVAAFNLLRLIRDRMLNVPDRVVGAVLAEVHAVLAAAGCNPESGTGFDMSKVHGILATEIRSVLEETADAAQR